MTVKKFFTIWLVSILILTGLVLLDNFLNPQLASEGISFTWHGWPGWYEVGHGLTRFAINRPGLFLANVSMFLGALISAVSLLGD